MNRTPLLWALEKNEWASARWWQSRAPTMMNGRAWCPSNELLPKNLSVAGPQTESFPLVIMGAENGEAKPRDMEELGMEAELLMEAENGESESRDMEEFGKALRKMADEQLVKAGAFLLPSFLKNVQELNNLVFQMGFERMDNYAAGAALRAKVDSETEVFNASDELPEIDLEPHQELSYQPRVPGKFFLYCQKPSSCGYGESGLTCMRSVTEQLREEEPALWNKLRQEGVRYQFNMAADPKGYYCWKRQVAPTMAEAEEVLRSKGYEWQWVNPEGQQADVEGDNDENQDLTFWYMLPAVIAHPELGIELFFNQFVGLHESYFWYHPDWEKVENPNQAFQWRHKTRGLQPKLPPFTTFFGNGDPPTPDELAQIRRVMWTNTRVAPLRAGDLLVLDNLLTSHSRLGWDPTCERKLFVSLGDPLSFN